MAIKFLSQIKKYFNMIFKKFWKFVYLNINILIIIHLRKNLFYFKILKYLILSLY